MSSFNIGLSGLRAVDQELNVISNNVANSSTPGFRSSRAEFSAIYGGGQAGGVEMSNVSQNFDLSGDVMWSGRGLDLAISGGGFFVVSDSNGQVSYTRAGLFQTDADNYLTTANGDRLQGYTTNAAGELQSGVIGDLQISASSLPAQASDSLTFGGNLDAGADPINQAEVPFDPENPASFNYSQSSTVYDSLGREHTVTQYFVKTDDNTWQVNYTCDGEAVGTPIDMEFNTDGSLKAPTTSPVLDLTLPGADPLSLTIDISDVKQFASDFNATTNQANGYGAGDLTGVRVDPDGSVYATFSNGQSLLQGQVVMADFGNPGGLMQTNNTSWQQTFSSGQPIIGVPGSGTMGTLTAGAYESSNVDLTGELVNLMTAQRNYQANSKTISSADKMTQVLFNTF